MVAFKVKDPATGVWLPVPTVGPIGPTGPAGPGGGPGVVISAALIAPWATGAVEFMVNGAAVTMTLDNVQRTTVHTDGQSKICDYPAGVTPPWREQRVAINGMFVQTKLDGVNLIIQSNAADWPITAAVNCQMTWAL
jgi:hypothetical protein